MATASATGDVQIHGVSAKMNDGRTNGFTTDERARWCLRAAIVR
jgi:hypothetical protein